MPGSRALGELLDQLKTDPDSQDLWRRVTQQLEGSVRPIADERVREQLERQWNLFEISASSGVAEVSGQLRRTVALLDHEPVLVWVVDGQTRPLGTYPLTSFPPSALEYASQLLSELVPGDWECSEEDRSATVLRYFAVVEEVDDPTRQVTAEQAVTMSGESVQQLGVARPQELVGEELGFAQPSLFVELVNRALLVGLRKASPLAPMGPPLHAEDHWAIWLRIHQALAQTLPPATVQELTALEEWFTWEEAGTTETFDLSDGAVWKVIGRGSVQLRLHRCEPALLRTGMIGDEEEFVMGTSGHDYANKALGVIFPTGRSMDVTFDDRKLELGGEPGAAFENWWAKYALLAAVRRDRPLHPVPVSEFLSAQISPELKNEAGQWVEIEEGLAVVSRHDYCVAMAILPDGDGYREVLPIKAVASPELANECLASEVGVPPGTWVGFDRGRLDATRVCERINQALRSTWKDEHEALLPLRDTFGSGPVSPQVAHALYSTLRSFHPIVFVENATGRARRFDDYRWAAKLEALDPESLGALTLVALRNSIDSLPAPQQDFAGRLLDRCEESFHDGDVKSLASSLVDDPRFGAGLMVSDRAGGEFALAIVFVVDKLLARSGDPERVQSHWVQDSLNIQQVGQWIAMLDDDTILSGLR